MIIIGYIDDIIQYRIFDYEKHRQIKTFWA